MIYSNVAFKQEVFFTSSNESLSKGSTFQISEPFLIKILSSIFRSFLKTVTLSFEKLGL